MSDFQNPALWGIVNLTPDSFSDGDPAATSQVHLSKAERLIADGATVLDIGAESTRPGASPVSTEDEWRRLLPFFELFRNKHPHFPLSLDTRNPIIAGKAIKYGIRVINDVGFAQNDELLRVALTSESDYVLMHSRGTPQTMSELTDYGTDLMRTIMREMTSQWEKLCRMGFSAKRIILDPGFGFAKTPEQCRIMMDHLSQWVSWRDDVAPQARLLLGISRKRFLQLYTGQNAPGDRDKISAELAKKAVSDGFQIIRTHDVALTKKALSL